MAIAFIVIAWLVLQVVDILVPMLSLPDWVGRLVLVLLLVSFPIALIFAWAFELTPEGIKREKDVERRASITSQTGRKLDFIIIGVLAVALAISVYANFSGDDAPVATATLQDDLSIAVLPFANRSANEADAFFVDGMHDDLLTRLAKISAFRVISRTSVMQYRDTEKPMKVIGDELGVSTLLEGGVQRAGDRIRINVQLIDADTDEHLWAETYNRRLSTDNIFEIQEDIASMIAVALHAALSPDEKQRIGERPTDNLKAYEAYLIGRQKLSDRSTEDVRQSIPFFEQAIAEDPGFAEAYASLAEAYMVQTNGGDLSLADMLAKSRPVVAKAQSLNPNLGIVHTVMGGLAEYEGDIESAEVHYRNAIDLSPSYVTAYIWLALLHEFYLGQPEESIRLYQKALELDPVMIVQRSNLAVSLSSVGRHEEAMQTVREALSVDPSNAQMHDVAGWVITFQTGRTSDAMPWLQRGAQLGARYYGSVAQSYANLGDFDAARSWLAGYARAYPDGSPGLVVAMYLHLADGRPEQAAGVAETLSEFSRDTTRLHEPLLVLRDVYIDNDREADALTVYRRVYPKLFLPAPKVSRSNFDAAVDLTLLLKLTGQQDALDVLAAACLELAPAVPRMAFWGRGLKDAELHAILGDRDAAIAALADAVADGYTWYHDADRPARNFAAIAGDPEFKRLMAEIQARVAVELKKVRAMESAGQLARTPDELGDVRFDLSL